MPIATLTRPLGIFAFALAAVMAALYAISQFVELPGGSAMGVVSLIAATMPAGQNFYKTELRRATLGEKLTFAVLATVIVAVLNIGALYGLMSYYGIPFTQANIMTLFDVPTQDQGLFLNIVLFGGLGIAFVGIYAMFWAAIRGAEKQAAKALR
jgi:nitrate reductase NapE component